MAKSSNKQDTPDSVMHEQLNAARVPDMFWSKDVALRIPPHIAKFINNANESEYFYNDNPKSVLFTLDPIPTNVLPSMASIFVRFGYKTQYVRAVRLLESIKSKEASYGFNLDLDRAWECDLLIIDCGFAYDFLNSLERYDRVVFHEFMIDYIQEGGCIISASEVTSFDDVYSPLQYLVDAHFQQVG